MIPQVPSHDGVGIAGRRGGNLHGVLKVLHLELGVIEQALGRCGSDADEAREIQKQKPGLRPASDSLRQDRQGCRIANGGA